MWNANILLMLLLMCGDVNNYEQRLITIAIKKARILSSLPFLNNEKQFEKSESTARTTTLRKKNIEIKNYKSNFELRFE